MICTKRLCLAVAVAACQIIALSAVQAATYYVRPSGSNANSGTSWSSAWAHPNKGQSVMVAGDMLVIAPGAYDTVQFVPPSAGGAQTAYVCSTYTVNGSDAGRNNTFIRGGRQVSLTWTSAGSNKWTATFSSPMTGTSPRDFVALFRDGNVCDPRLSTSEANSQNEYAYDASSNVFTLYSTTNPSTSTWRVSWRPVMDTGPGQSNVLIFGLTIEEGSQRLIVLGDWDHSSPKPDSTYIKYCNLRKVIELETAHNGSIILSQTNDPTSASQWSNDLQVVGCSLSQVSTVDYGNGTHGGVGIEYYFVRDSRIDSNVFIGPMGSAIALKMGCYADNGVKSLNWSIKYNRISDCFDDAVWIGNKVGNLDFVGNIVERCEVGFNIHTSNPCGNDPTQGNINVLNNTFFNNDVNFTASAANSIGGNQIKYNIFFDTSGVVSNNYVYTLGFRLRGGEAPQETPSTETYWSNGINNNMYYIANGQTFVGRFMSNCGWAGQPTPTQSQWTAHFDQASVFGANPKFAASNAGDYSRPSSSGEINVTHSGRTWTRYGAWQGSGGACTPPAAPSFVSPANGATGLLLPLVLDWSDVSGVTSYQVQVDNNSDFSSPAIDQLTAVSTYSALGLTSGTSFYWRVRSQNSCGWGSWTASRSFVTGTCTLPATVVLALPAAGATNLSLPVTLDWNDVATAIKYQVQVDDNSDFTSPAVDQQPTASTYSIASLTAGTTFYWRARAQNACDWGTWSASRTFAVGSSDVTAPTIASVTATNITDNSALITWTTNESASSQINYGATSSYGSSTTLDATLVTSHQQTISGLTPLATYHYRVRSKDASGNESVSGDFTLATIDALTKIDNGITPTVSSTYSGYSVSTINDGTLDPFGGTSTTWASAQTTTDAQWVDIDFGASRQVKRVVVYWAWNSTQSKWMTSQQLKLQSWNGSAYVDITTVNNTVSDSCTSITVPSVTTTRLRYYQPANMGPATYPSIAWMSELDIFGATAANTAPTMPTLASPASGATGVSLSPILTLNNSTDAQGNTINYSFQVSTSSSFGSITAQASSVAQGTTGTTSWTVSPNLSAGTTYYWRARAYDGALYSSYSASRSFATGSNTAPGAPTPKSPISNVRVSDMTPNLVVTNAVDANGDLLTYQFELYNGAGTTLRAQSPMVASGASTTTWTVSITLAYATNYTWRVRAYDGQSWSVWTALQNFRTNRAPSSPQVSDDLDATQPQSSMVVLGATSSVDPDGDSIAYQFEIYDGADTTMLVKSASIPADPSKTVWAVPSDLTPGKQYTWRVRASDGEALSDWSALAKFTTASAVACGDEDASGTIDIKDAIFLVNYIFANGAAPNAAGGGDVNCDQVTNISDAILLIEFLYANGYEPCAKCGH